MSEFWITEGFDTKDLQEAKELLGELSHWEIESLDHFLKEKSLGVRYEG